MFLAVPPSATPSAILIHGFMGQPAMWDRVVDAFGDAASIGRVRLPGHGRAADRPTGMCFASLVDALAEELQTSAPVCLVGYSLGARVALALSVRHPALVRSALLIGVNPGLDAQDARRERQRWDAQQADYLQTKGLNAFIDHWERMPLFASQQQLTEPLRQTQRAQRQSHDAEGLAWAMHTLGLGRMPCYWSALAESAIPVRLLTGEQDDKYCRLAERMTTVAPRATHRVVPAVGHNVALEAPATVAEELRALLGATDS